MTYDSIKTRVEQARALDHEESQLELLKEIRKEIQPLIAEMNRAIGRSIRFEENEEDMMSDNYVTASTLKGEVYITEINLSDTYGLDRVRQHLARLNLEEAKETAESLDTAVRERIPEEVFDFFHNRT